MTPIRKQPCSTCPYRCDTPAGVWHPDEYAKLRRYDRETMGQPAGLFLCHHSQDEGADEALCRGWVAVGGWDLLALRLAAATGEIDPAEVTGPVSAELYSSHSAAADAGLAGVHAPGRRARAAIARLVSTQERRLTEFLAGPPGEDG